MRKIFLLVGIVIGFTSCSMDDDTLDYTSKLAPVVSVEIPDELIYHEEYTFKVTYEKSTECAVFDGYIYERNENERLIGVVNVVYLNKECDTPSTDGLMTVDLDFQVQRDDFYIFKFWQGEDEEGESIYLTKKVPVVMPEETE